MFGYARQSGDTATLSGSVPSGLARRLAASGGEQFVRGWMVRYPTLAATLETATLAGSVRATACFGHRMKRPFADGILFLGDAARFADPFTGEGIHHAVESGILAARTAARALAAGDTSARSLSGYEKDRAEMASRYSLCEIVHEICMRPRLLDHIGKRLRQRPALGRTLVAALVDILPSRAVLNPGFVLKALAP
jgi:flavin-dependent dehydrogenase